MFDKFRDLQKSINRIGLGASVRTIPVPRMGEDEASALHINEKYNEIIFDEDVIILSRDLFVSGFYSQAVEEVFKFLDNFVKKKSSTSKSGADLMFSVFAPTNPLLKINAMSNQSENDEQKGYNQIFAGAMTGIRNPCAHENNWFKSEQLALEAIIIGQHLVQKAKNATV